MLVLAIFLRRIFLWIHTKDLNMLWIWMMIQKYFWGYPILLPSFRNHAIYAHFLNKYIDRHNFSIEFIYQFYLIISQSFAILERSNSSLYLHFFLGIFILQLCYPCFQHDSLPELHFYLFREAQFRKSFLFFQIYY